MSQPDAIQLTPIQPEANRSDIGLIDTDQPNTPPPPWIDDEGGDRRTGRSVGSSVPRRSVLTACLALMVITPAPTAIAADMVPAAIVEALKGGGHVVYFRHGATTYSGVDRIEWPRSRQRLLSELGIDQSRMIGAAFERHTIFVGEVLASPFARCRDMAEIAFGRVDERMEILGLLSDADGRAGRVAFLRSRLADSPGPAGDRILVSHTSNIHEVAGVRLREGEAVVVRPQGEGSGFAVLGTPMAEDW